MTEKTPEIKHYSMERLLFKIGNRLKSSGEITNPISEIVLLGDKVQLIF